MTQRLRESLTLLLIAALPFHAFAVTVGTHFLQGPGKAPLLLLALWKEALLGAVVLLALVEILSQKRSGLLPRTLRPDLLDWCIVLAFITAILVSGEGSTAQFLLGLKYDFLPLAAFVILRRVPWTRTFFQSAVRLLLLIGAIVAALGLLSLLVPLPWFTALGYSDLHSVYMPGAPLAAFQFLEGTDIRRIQSVMSGPNQLGLWLLLPIAASLQWVALAFRGKRRMDVVIAMVFFLLLSSALMLTYSRSAWVAFVVLLLVTGSLSLRTLLRTGRQRVMALLSVGIVLGITVMISVAVAPHILVRSRSLQGHWEKPMEALSIIRNAPLGLGLGTAGPASNRVSDTCMFFEQGADTAWAEGREDICVFVGGEQVLPERVCTCPLLTENWYLQWGVEMGVAGLVLSLLLPLLILWSARGFGLTDHRLVPVLSFLGVSVAGLFLHSFEDSAVAYTVWILLAATGLRAVGREQSA